ncbi:MAG: hypothetical protein ACI9KE_000264 [Polyangiales bacterium]|jgi:hypothetical protein
MKLFRRWCELMDERESPTRLAMVRIAMSVVLLTDLFWVAHYDLVGLLWSPHEVGGISLISTWGDASPMAYSFFGDAAAAWIFGAVVVSALFFGAGLFTRAACAVLLLTYAQLGGMNISSDRGIDMVFRAILVILFFSRCGQTWSLDAYRRSGSFVDESAAPAWPRYLIIVQVVWIYFTAGLHKTQSAWWPAGDFSALWRILHDPHFARFDLGDATWFYPITQLGTLGTMLFEIGAPIFLLSLFYRRSAERGGRLRTWFNRLRVREAWLFLGISFHLGLVFTMRLGIFPLGMLALYPVFANSPRLVAKEESVVPSV